MILHPTDMLPPGTTWLLSYGEGKPSSTLGVTTREDFDAEVARLQSKGCTVWMARAGFAGKARKKANVRGVKSLAIDVDTDEAGDKNGRPCYRNKQEAATAVLRLVKEHSVPAPSVVVDSGGGLHLWWLMDNVVPPDEWTALASRWKAWLKALDPKLAADTSRWADCNGLLRPWPSINNKYAPPREVRAVSQTGRVYTQAALSSVVPANVPADTPAKKNANVPKVAGARRDTGTTAATSAVPMNDFLACGVIKHHIKSRAAVASEPEWRAVLSAAAFLPAAIRRAAAHTISAPHPGYSEEETDAKFSRILSAVESDSVGPPSCGTLRELVMGDAEDRSRCAGCPLAAAATYSNINFVKAMKERHLHSRRKPEPAPAGGSPVAAGMVTTADEITSLLEDVHLPPYIGSGPSDGEPFYLGEGADGVVSLYGRHSKGSDVLFTPTWWVERHFGPRSVVIVHDAGTRKYTRHVVARELLGSNQSLYHKLASLGIANAANRGERHITEAINRYANTVQVRAPVQNISAHCGLSEDGSFFALGDVAVAADGSLGRSVAGSSQVDAIFRAVRFKGTLEGGLINLHTALQGGTSEARFVLGASLASPLLALGAMSGAVVSVVGPQDSGKTLALIASAQVWGDYSGIMTSGSDTYNAIIGRAGALHNLPFLIDEATLMTPQHLSDLVYAATVGRPKRANNSDGSTRALPPPWKLTTLVTTNKSLRGVIESIEIGDDTAAAKQARVIEIEVPDNMFPGVSNRTELGAMLAEHSGLVGLEFVRHIMRNRDRLRRSMKTAVKAIEDARTSVARYAAHTLASYIVATDELRALGWWPVDRETDMRTVTQILQRTSKAIADTTGGRNAGLVAAFLSAVARNTMSVEVADDGSVSSPAGDHNMSSVLVRQERHKNRIVTYAGVSYAASVVRSLLSRGVDKAHQRGVVTKPEIDYYLSKLKTAGLDFTVPNARVRMGAGMGQRLASMSTRLECICWVAERDAEDTAMLPGRPRLVSVDGKSVN